MHVNQMKSLTPNIPQPQQTLEYACESENLHWFNPHPSPIWYQIPLYPMALHIVCILNEYKTLLPTITKPQLTPKCVQVSLNNFIETNYHPNRSVHYVLKDQIKKMSNEPSKHSQVTFSVLHIKTSGICMIQPHAVDWKKWLRASQGDFQLLLWSFILSHIWTQRHGRWGVHNNFNEWKKLMLGKMLHLPSSPATLVVDDRGCRILGGMQHNPMRMKIFIWSKPPPEPQFVWIPTTAPRIFILSTGVKISV